MKTDSLRSTGCGGEEGGAGIGPGAGGGGEMVGSEFAAFVPRGAEAFERRGRCFIIPRGSPLVDDGGIFEEAVDFRRCGVAENVDLEGLRRAANERERHHGIAEMMEFDDEETRFHKKILTAARRSRRYE
jgi:hypothetical protein